MWNCLSARKDSMSTSARLLILLGCKVSMKTFILLLWNIATEAVVLWIKYDGTTLFNVSCVSAYVCVCACVRACVCVRECVRACVFRSIDFLLWWRFIELAYCINKNMRRQMSSLVGLVLSWGRIVFCWYCQCAHKKNNLLTTHKGAVTKMFNVNKCLAPCHIGWSLS